MKRFASDASPHPTVLTVVCAVRNGAHCIAELLASYRRERTEGSRLIVLDGASNDGTWDVLLQHRDAIDVAVSEPDNGIYDAWNKSLTLCAGSYVAFIGADDRIACGALRALVSACGLQRDEPHIVAGFNVQTRDAVPVALLGAPFRLEELHRRMMIAQVMSAHNLTWLRSVGGFDASFRSSGDYELLLRERRGLRVSVINHVLAFMEDGGISRRGLRPFTENYRALRKNGFPAWQCAALFARAFGGHSLRRLLRR